MMANMEINSLKIEPPSDVQSSLKPIGDVVLEGEVGINLMDIGSKRIFSCDSCGQKQVRIRKNEYVKIRHDVKTRHW